MSYLYRPDLLAPYLALDQGEKIQAECVSRPPLVPHLTLKLMHMRRRLG